MNSLAGKRVLITAGGSGIGACFARRFHAEGAKVAICDIDSDALTATASTLPSVIAVAANVTQPDEMQVLFDRLDRDWGGVDMLCANAGTGGPAGAIEDLSLDDWRACISANLDGAFLACGWAARHMKAQGSGSMLLTSSTAGLWGYPMRSPYATAKWGVIGLMKTLASELGPYGVRVNALCPGAVEGPRMERVIEREAKAHGLDPEEMRQRYVKGIAMKTWVTADDLADTALFLASDASRKISGQALAVDGHTESLVG
ncbi:SDR family oxidoreductase [Aliiroseovarius sp. M344]|uniref:SDR family oxidoreductase n=1 Tax=Aliiroseovarius sp. M344 TaxID=2867010 RepID=UPI0021ADEB66|nr:SDR family oxidoreductase [Aliiroseovarius sp. M344]UWQ13194.1 SDR family oxidoreductase [Aliiroseovarius sp. M344]